MYITTEQREERYERGSDTVRFLYADQSSGEALREIFTSTGLSESLYTAYAVAVGDVILGFYKKSELANILIERMGIAESVAQKIVAGLAGFLAKLEEPQPAPVSLSVPKATIDAREKLELRPEGAMAGGETPPATQGNAPKPLTREEVLTALSPKRTMASDIASVRGEQQVEGPSSTAE